jgi:urease accessory protein
MLELTIKPSAAELAKALPDILGTLRLPYEIRQKSRFRTTLVDGSEVGVVIDRGSVLRGGDYLRTADHRYVLVEAAPESVSRVSHDDSAVLARTAYHLGNRHVPLQVSDCWLRYLHDHVLDEMCQQLGMTVEHESAPFEPEAGAYSTGHGHHHD